MWVGLAIRPRLDQVDFYKLTHGKLYVCDTYTNFIRCNTRAHLCVCVHARARLCVFQLSTYKLEVIEVLGWTSVARVDSYRMLISLRVRVIGNEGSLKLAASTLYHQMSRSRSIKIVFCFLCTHTATTPNTNPQAENSFFFRKKLEILH